LGEITEALRRAKLEREGAASVGAPAAPALPAAPPAPSASPAPRGPGIEISADTSGHWAARAALVDRRGGVSESFRHFALRTLQALRERRARTLFVTSALRAEGKTTTACNLALALTSLGAHTIALVDLDLRRPSVATGLGVATRVGLEAVLAGAEELRSACVPTALGGLDLYLTGAPRQHAHELLARPAMTSVLRELSRRYEVVVVDTPPVLLVPDVPLVLPHADACLAVARVGFSRVHAFSAMLGAIGREKLIGVFLNQSREAEHVRQYGYYLQPGETG
jgi:Mrp family chromosome partitioning ATPase